MPNRTGLGPILVRVKAQVRRAVADSIDRRRISDVGADEEVKVRVAGTSEPAFRQAGGADGDYVLPGTGTLNRGDHIPKPQGGSGGRGHDARHSGGGEDSFEFTLTREEFLDCFFEELELPRLDSHRTRRGHAEQTPPRRLLDRRPADGARRAPHDA